MCQEQAGRGPGPANCVAASALMTGRIYTPRVFLCSEGEGGERGGGKIRIRVVSRSEGIRNRYVRAILNSSGLSLRRGKGRKNNKEK